MSMFGSYDPDGQPISPEEASRLLGDPDRRRVGYDEIPLIGGSVAVVSTVFLVFDHALGPGPPVLWETMVFIGGDLADEYCGRYTTREAAEQGHRDVVEFVRSAHQGG